MRESGAHGYRTNCHPISQCLPGTGTIKIMYTLSLQWVLFILLALLIGTAMGTWGIAQWVAHRRQQSSWVDTLEPLLATIPIGVVVLGNKEQILFANDRAQQTLSLPTAAPTLPEQPWVAYLHEDLQIVDAGQNGRYRTVQIDTAERPRSIQWWVRRWTEVTLLFVSDVTQEQQAEQSAHLLLSDLGHELRTPLATLLTHLEVLRLPSISAEMRQQSLHFMREEVQRLTRLGDNVLELGRLESSKGVVPQAVDLAALLTSLSTQMQGNVQEVEMTLQLELQSPLPSAIGDADRLRQVFLNLVNNAIKYGEAGNQITISTEFAAGKLHCAVCDTGPGIAAEHIPQLTRRFYRAAPAGVPGSGLGLAMVAEILRHHQSYLEIESTTNAGTSDGNHGTCMRFTLPTADQQAHW